VTGLDQLLQKIPSFPSFGSAAIAKVIPKFKMD